MKSFILILFFTSIEVFGQRIIQVVSQDDGMPIPFVHISVENSRLGFTTDERGFAEISEQVNQKTLLFYAVGYNITSVQLDSIAEKIELKPKTTVLDEIQVFAKKSKKITLDEIESRWIALSAPKQGNGGVSVITAKTFNTQKDHDETLHVQSVFLKIKSKIDKAKFQLHVYDLNEIGNPEEDLILVPIIVETEKGSQIVEIDLTEYQLVFPDNGLAIGVEWLLIESNRTEENGDIKYEPSFYYQESEGRSLQLIHGEWIETPFFQSQKENRALSCQLNLTN